MYFLEPSPMAVLPAQTLTKLTASTRTFPMAKRDKLHCAVITPERQVLDADVDSVVLPAHDGLIGILRDRAPLLCEVGIGVLTLSGGEVGRREMFVDGGFAQVLHNDVTILTTRAQEPK